MEALACVSDFDDCLVRLTDRSKLFGIFTSASDGLSRAGVERIYRKVRDSIGFSATHMINAIRGEGYSINEKAVCAALDRWLKNSLEPYHDTMQFVGRVRASNIPFIVITFGEEKYQIKKVQMSGIPYDQLIVVSSPAEKVERIREVIKKFGRPIVYIDDKATTLDKIARAFSPETVLTVRPVRGPYRMLAAKRMHWEIASFAQLPAFSSA